MVAGGSLTRENVEQLRRAGATYQMILKEAENLGIISETDYDEIADAAEDELRRRAPGQITEAADILYLIRMGLIDSHEGVEILVRNNTLRQDIVDDLLEDGSSYEQILEDLAATQAARRREQRGGGRTRRKRGSCKI
jgi:hypothetical protein